MLAFHGTTLKSFIEMVQGNFQNSPERVWDCSIPDEFYVYDWDNFINNEIANNFISYEFEFDLDKSNYNNVSELIGSAFSSAYISAAISNYNQNELIVLEMNIPDDLLTPDISCPGMQDVACSIPCDKMDISFIKRIHINDNYQPSFRLFYLAPQFDYNTDNTDIISHKNISKKDILAMKIINSSQSDVTLLDDIHEEFKDYRTIDNWHDFYESHK